MRVPPAIVRFCRAVASGVEVKEDSDVEYWSRVRSENGSNVVTFVLRRAEICWRCKFFHFVFVVSSGADTLATCADCHDLKTKDTKDKKDMESV